MKYLDEKYAKVLEHKEFAICTLKIANPSAGDEMGYVIDDELFIGKVFNHLGAAMAAIDSKN